jgi:hypothetical protein
MADEAFEKVDLPSGGWAILRDPDTITVKMRKPLQRVQMRVGFDADLQAVVRYQMRVQRELLAARKAAADAGVEFDDESFEPSLPQTVKQSALSDEQLDLLGDLATVTTVTLIESWSFDAPVSRDALEDLPPKDFDALVEAAAKYRDDLLPSFDVDPDDNSPTEPSGE